jgi:hypothetical protein
MKLSDNQSQHSSRTRYPPKRFRPKTGVSRGRISECWRIAISSSSASPPSIHSARRRRAFSGIVRPASSTTKTARRRSVLGKRPCLGRVIALAVPVRRAGCALIILVVESGDLVSWGTTFSTAVKLFSGRTRHQRRATVSLSAQWPISSMPAATAASGVRRRHFMVWSYIPISNSRISVIAGSHRRA